MSGIYSILKVVFAPIFLAIAEEEKYIERVWMILIIPMSLMHALYYWQVYRYAKRRETFLRIANQVSHAAFFMPDQVSLAARQSNVHDNIINFRNPASTEIVDKEVKVLSLEIKYDVLKEDWRIMIASRTLFLLYTGLHVWGYIIFINNSTPNVCDYFIIVVFFLGTYQYLEIYLGIVGLVIVLPFILMYLLIQAIKKYRKKSKISAMLEGKKYNPLKLKGEHSCHICMEEYKENDILTILPCNEMHHFHKACLEEWIRVSGTCPLCRLDI